MKKLENFTKQSFSLELIAQNGSEKKIVAPQNSNSQQGLRTNKR
jgi:hypothetical protein